MQTTVYSLYFSLPLQGMILQNHWTFKPCEGQLLPLLLPCSAQRAGWGCTGTSRQRPVHAAPAQTLLGNSQRPGSPPSPSTLCRKAAKFSFNSAFSQSLQRAAVTLTGIPSHPLIESASYGNSGKAGQYLNVHFHRL